MRITTQMLDASMRKSGLNFTRPSLLNYINKNTSNSLLSALGNSKVNKYSSINKTSSIDKTGSITASNVYKKIEKAADNLSGSASKFVSSKDNFFEKEYSDNVMYYEVESLVDDYNSTLNSLGGTQSALNSYYAQMLKGAAVNSSSSLREIGISVDSKGALSINKDILRKSDKDTLEKVLGSSSEFTNKINFIAERVSNNASANINSASGQYSSFGDYYSAYSSKFDLFR